METIYSRTELIIGWDKLELLKSKRIAVFGIGGVGGYVVEALARCGIGKFELIDKDVVSKSNINRQIIALSSTIGKPKAEVMKERILDINQTAEVTVRQCFFLPDNSHEFDFSKYDYIVDAVDIVAAKLEITMMADKHKVPIISSMGMGNKLNPLEIKVSDIYKTKNCPLARVMRRELKKLGIKELKTVYSEEIPIGYKEVSDNNLNYIVSDMPTAVDVPEIKSSTNYLTVPKVKVEGRRSVPGSISFLPSAAGLIIASEVVKDLCGIHGMKA